LCSETNKPDPQQTQWYVPASLWSQYRPVKAGSVAPRRVTAYSVDVSRPRQKASGCSIRVGEAIKIPLIDRKRD